MIPQYTEFKNYKNNKNLKCYVINDFNELENSTYPNRNFFSKIQ